MPVFSHASLPSLACALSALIASGCTLDNSVNDPDQNTPPPNVFRAPFNSRPGSQGKFDPGREG